MEKRKIGGSDLWVSKMGLGCMSLGTDVKKAAEIIESALDEGINYFDTADLYSFGVNEEIVGKTLAAKRDEVVIATKVGNRWNNGEDTWHWDASKEYIKEAVKESLRRLHTDYIDLYQLHGGTMEDRFEETVEAFDELQAEGLVRYYGISSIRPNVIRRYAEHSSAVSVMMQYSLLDRRPEEVSPLLKEHDISIVTRGSVAKGILSDKTLGLLEVEKLEQEYLDYSPAEISEVIASIKAKLLIGNRTLNEIALQFALANEAVAAVVTGASTVDQVRDNARAVNAQQLSSEELGYLQIITKESKYTQHR